MLMAEDSTNQRVYIDCADPDADYFCPVCGEKLIQRRGEIRIHHYAHQPCSSCSYGVGESIQHIKLKLAIKEIIEQRYSPVTSELEYQIGKYRADYYFELERAYGLLKVAVEVVYKHESWEQYQDKNDFYHDRRICTWWIYDEDTIVDRINYFYKDMKLNELQHEIWKNERRIISLEWESRYFMKRTFKYIKGIWRTRTLKVDKEEFIWNDEFQILTDKKTINIIKLEE